MQAPVTTPEENALKAKVKETVTELLQTIDERNGDAYVRGSRLSVKNVAYLYAYARKHPYDIVAAYPAALTHARLHVALAHYYLNREAYDAEIARDIKMNHPNVLAGRTGHLPRMGLKSLVDWSQEPGSDK